MHTTRLRSRRDAGWRARQQAVRCRDDVVVHTFPLIGPLHLVEGYPIQRCWCGAGVDMQEDGFVVNHNLVN